MRLCLLVLACGCWRGTGAPATSSGPPLVAAPVALAPRGMSCDQVAQHVHVILTGGPDPTLAGRADVLRDVVLRRCRADSWSTELRSCLVQASSLDASNECEVLATPAQQQALDQDIEAIEEAE